MPQAYDRRVGTSDIIDKAVIAKKLADGLQEIVGGLVLGQDADPGAFDGDRIIDKTVTRAKFAPNVTDMATYWEMKEDFNVKDSGTEILPWAFDVENSATADYMADEANGVYQLAIEGTGETQATQLTHGDQLLIDMDADPIIEFRIRVDGIADMTAVEQAFWGVCPVHTNSETSSDNIDDSCWFLIKAGGTGLWVESDDGSVDNDDKDSGLTLVDDVWTTFKIDFSNLADVKMYVDGVEQAYGTIVMSASAGTVVQPIVCIQRSTADETEVGVQVEIDYIHIYQKRTA